MVGGLNEGATGFERRREILLDELRAEMPRLVLLVEPEFPELDRFLKTNYAIAGVDMDDDRPDKTIMLALMHARRPVRTVDWEWRAPK